MRMMDCMDRPLNTNIKCVLNIYYSSVNINMTFQCVFFCLNNLMQITKFSDFALRILIHLAIVDGELRTTREIAKAHNLSFNHLAKVAQWLTNEGYVKSIRGRSGGMRLACSAESISIGELMRKSEQGSPLVECMKGGEGSCCVMMPACGLLPILYDAQEAFFQSLDQRSLQDVIMANHGIVNLLKMLEIEQENI